jgi:hypothetical protein
MARFLHAQRAANGGKLSRPDWVEEPTETRMTSHPFGFVRKAFLALARDNDPDAAVVYRMGDMVGEPVFHCGIVAAYFVVSEMERLDASPTRSS